MKNKENYPIDFVITWVDDSDPIWQKDKTKYLPKDKKADTNDARYRDWGMLKYWFRAVEENAPWVNKIHFVTYGHIPAWLNISHPKIHIVKHEDFIDKKYLPTFNSCAIEVNLHKIPGLSEHFVYFNDDMYINKLTTASIFFSGGLPRNTYILTNLHNNNITASIRKNSNILARNFNNANKNAYSINNGPLMALKNLSIPTRNKGYISKHVPASFLKESFNTVWKKYAKKMEETQTNKFRTTKDVSQWVFEYYQLYAGLSTPRNYSISKYYDALTESETVIKDILKKKHTLICINDTDSDKQNDNTVNAIKIALSERYPNKSSYELPESPRC